VSLSRFPTRLLVRLGGALFLAAAGAASTAGAVAPAPLGPWDRARGDLLGDPADEDRVPVSCEAGRTLRVRLRGTGPGRGAPTLRLLRPDASEEPVTLVVTGSRAAADVVVDETGVWTLVVGPPPDGRRDWRLVLRDDGPRPGTRARVDLRDLVVWKGNVAPLLAGRCVSCHSGPFPEAGVRLGSWANAVPEADRILFQVENGRMPPTGGLAPSQVDRVRRWVQDGALRR
jgi:hypothetical protein